MHEPPLRELQALFWAAISSEPGEVRAEAALVELVPASPHLEPIERVEIYAGMYWRRILDVLRQDFARTAAVLGDRGFESLVKEYLRRRPSRHPSIARVGEALASFLAERPPAGAPPFAADLARLEWARVEGFGAPGVEPLRLEDLSSLPARRWAELHLAAVPSVAILELDWPVHRLLDAESPPIVGPSPTVLRVWRRHHLVFHSVVDATEGRALRVLRAGGTFADVGEACGDATETASLFARWLEDGVLSRAPGLSYE